MRTGSRRPNPGSHAAALAPAVERVAIDKHFGLIGGRSIGRPPLGPGPLYSFGDDWLTIDFNHRDVFASLGLPLGVFFEPSAGLAFELRSGFRHVWGGGQLKADFVPVGLDFLATPHLDLSASVELPGETDFYFNLVQARATLALRF